MDKGNSQPLINLLTFQEVAFWLRLRTMFFLWARQRGKSYLIAAKAIDRMLERAGRSCYFVSASIATGKEIVEKRPKSGTTRWPNYGQNRKPWARNWAAMWWTSVLTSCWPWMIWRN